MILLVLYELLEPAFQRLIKYRFLPKDIGTMWHLESWLYSLLWHQDRQKIVDLSRLALELYHEAHEGHKEARREPLIFFVNLCVPLVAFAPRSWRGCGEGFDFWLPRRAHLSGLCPEDA
jgi:hypothetical protein